MRAILAVGGLDPTGGAGLLADARTAWHHGVHAACVATALTAQGEAGVTWISRVPPARVVEQILGALSASTICAVKLGMLGQVELAAELASLLASACHVPVVLDPVLAASSGEPLLQGDLAGLEPLLGLAEVVTPNLPELALLTGRQVGSRAQVGEAAAVLLEAGARSVLVKGGHADGPPIDLLFDRDGCLELHGPRVAVTGARGTGCALATALACRLGEGIALAEAASLAKSHVAERLERSRTPGGGQRVLP